MNGRGWGAPSWVVGFCAACKGKALFSVDADPAHRCMHAGSRLASQQSECKGLPTDDTQHTEDMDLCREVRLPTKKQLYSVASVETHNYFMFCISLLKLQDLWSDWK